MADTLLISEVPSDIPRTSALSEECVYLVALIDTYPFLRQFKREARQNKGIQLLRGMLLGMQGYTYLARRNG